MIDRRLLTNFDWKIIILVVFITAIGVINIISASASYTVQGTSYPIKQIYWAAAGLSLAMLICSVDYHILEDFAYWIYGILIFLLLLVLVLGRTSMGATRWFHLGFLNIQPSEPMKIVIIMVLARYLADHYPLDSIGLKEIAIPLIMILFPSVLIMKQPDLGTAVIVFLVAFAILFTVGIRWSTIITMALAVIPTLYIGWHYILKSYQKNRILNFLSPERDPLKSGYHIIQSKIAVGSGGFWGKGFLHGTQSQLRFLPEQHTDFAFSVFAEEWGFIGCFVLLIMYALLILWGLNVANRCNDRFGSLMAVGITAMLFWHIIINIGMVIGLFPVVGVPLPLFSYGGTSMLTSMIGIGILLNISMRRFMFST